MAEAVEGALELTDENVEMVLDEVRGGMHALLACSVQGIWSLPPWRLTIVHLRLHFCGRCTTLPLLTLSCH